MEIVVVECVCTIEWWGKTESCGLRRKSLSMLTWKEKVKEEEVDRTTVWKSIVILKEMKNLRRLKWVWGNLRIRAVHSNEQHQEVVSSGSEGRMAFTCCKGIGRWCWSLYCALNLTGDLKGPLQVIVSYQGIMVTVGLSVVQQWGGEPTARTSEILETQGKHSYLLLHSNIFLMRGAADELPPSVGDMGWMQRDHSLSRAPCSFPGTHLLFCLLFCE